MSGQGAGAGDGPRAGWTDCDVLALAAGVYACAVRGDAEDGSAWLCEGVDEVRDGCGDVSAEGRCTRTREGGGDDERVCGVHGCEYCGCVHSRCVTGLCIICGRCAAAASVLLQGLTGGGSGGAALVRIRALFRSFALSCARPRSWRHPPPRSRKKR